MLRFVILLFGWPILLAGSGFLFYRTYRFYLAVQKNVWGKLVLTMVLGWLLTMYSLGIISTMFMFVALQAGTLIVLPIFGIWFCTMIAITRAVLRWNVEAVRVNAFNTQLQTLVEERTHDLFREKEMAEAERNKLKVIIASITDGVIAVDLNKKIILANQAITQITGYLPEELIGKMVLEAFRFSLDGKLLEEKDICPTAANQFEGSLIEHKSMLLTGKGVERAIELTVSQIRERLTAQVGCIMTLHDLTKDQELEEMKLDFVSMAAHELRTPLTAVRGYVALLEDECVAEMNEKGKQYLSRLAVSSDSLGGLIDNLLSVSRIERNSFKVEMEPLNLVPIISDAITTISQQAQIKKQILTFTPPAETPPLVMADAARINQVMINLLANAVHYTQEEGKISVSIEQQTDQLSVVVSDTGQGMPKDAIPKLFTKFFRISGSLEQGAKGTGLGLYITKSIIDMHKGTISVDSELGKGTTFQFSLPLASKKEIADVQRHLTEPWRKNTNRNIVINPARARPASPLPPTVPSPSA